MLKNFDFLYSLAMPILYTNVVSGCAMHAFIFWTSRSYYIKWPSAFMSLYTIVKWCIIPSPRFRVSICWYVCNIHMSIFHIPCEAPHCSGYWVHLKLIRHRWRYYIQETQLYVLINLEKVMFGLHVHIRFAMHSIHSATSLYNYSLRHLILVSR